MRQLRNGTLVVLALLMLLPTPVIAASILVNWDANTESDLAGYKVHYGTQSGAYTATVDIGNATSFQLSSVGAGSTYYLSITAYDTSGNESGYSSEVTAYVPMPDTTIPTGTIAINAGSAATPTRVVTLTLSATDAVGPVVGMKISNDGVSWSEGDYATSQAWALSEGDGVKTVYVMFKDAAGNWSDPVGASIRLLQDTDGDGLSDSWETAYGLDINDPTDAEIDSDFDGYSNFEEYYAGTNPTGASDNLPVARAGADQQSAPTRIYLDGSASTDPHGLTLQYTWTFVSGPVNVDIENATTAKASFLGTRAGAYQFKLTCNNGRASSIDTVNVTILNSVPTVSAGGDMTTDTLKQLVLHAAGEDPNGDTLSYQWKILSGTGVTVSDLRQQDVAVVFSTAGQYRLSVTCSDGTLTSAADEVTVTVNAVNHAPTADAGADQTVQVGQQVALNGSGSIDPDGNSLTYSWRQVSGTAMALQNSESQTPAFAAVATGIYQFELTVSDGLISSVPDVVFVTVVRQNNAPVADAGSDQIVLVGDLATLDAGTSYDPDGDVLSYTWTQTSGASVVLAGAQTARPTFTPTTSGVLGFTVKVSDGQVSTQDTVVVTVDDVNQVPVAEAGQDRTAQTGTTVALDGSASNDPDGDTVSFIWSQVSGPAVSLNSPNSSAPSFVPTEAGTYVFQLKVYDGTDTSSADIVTVTAQATAVVLSLVTPQVGATVSENPLFTWNGSGMVKYKVLITMDKKKYSNIYTGPGTSCRMNSSLWSWFMASGSTVYWYVEGTTSNNKTYKSSMSYFKKR